MIGRYFKMLGFTLTVIFLATANVFAQSKAEEGHILVSLRMIGHQMLLNASDSTSRVLPIEKDGDRYEISFASDFKIDPGYLVVLIDSVVKESGIAENYLVEIEDCDSSVVVYSYEIGNALQSAYVPCLGRPLPVGCYTMAFTILDFIHLEPIQSIAKIETIVPVVSEQKGVDYSEMTIITVAVLLLIGISVYFKKRSGKAEPSSNLITLGAYQFDTRNMELLYKGEVIELTSKESDLLLLLHTSANSTLERELILKAVWGDDGDYVGRTLDVFISKLRKKLEGDTSLKIVNVRGVGYKLILNE